MSFEQGRHQALFFFGATSQGQQSGQRLGRIDCRPTDPAVCYRGDAYAAGRCAKCSRESRPAKCAERQQSHLPFFIVTACAMAGFFRREARQSGRRANAMAAPLTGTPRGWPNRCRPCITRVMVGDGRNLVSCVSSVPLAALSAPPEDGLRVVRFCCHGTDEERGIRPIALRRCCQGYAMR